MLSHKSRKRQKGCIMAIGIVIVTIGALIVLFIFTGMIASISSPASGSSSSSPSFISST